MKYEKDFFMKINCHANEWRETLHLEGSKNKWRILYNKMDNNKYNWKSFYYLSSFINDQ